MSNIGKPCLPQTNTKDKHKIKFDLLWLFQHVLVAARSSPFTVGSICWETRHLKVCFSELSPGNRLLQIREHRSLKIWTQVWHQPNPLITPEPEPLRPFNLLKGDKVLPGLSLTSNSSPGTSAALSPLPTSTPFIATGCYSLANFPWILSDFLGKEGRPGVAGKCTWVRGSKEGSLQKKSLKRTKKTNAKCHSWFQKEWEARSFSSSWGCPARICLKLPPSSKDKKNPI